MINLELDGNLFNDSFRPLLYDYSNRFEAYYGGAGSGKSVFITQKLIIRACSEKIRILICRRYGSTLRQTVFTGVKEVLANWKLTPYVKINESDMRITFPNGSEMLFTGLDSEEKLLSLTNIGSIWIEEVWECPKDIFDQLNLRMRGKNKNQQILMSWNPISENHWLFEFVNDPPQSCYIHHSTFKDNKFLSKEYTDALEELRVKNPQKARVYYYGLFGVDTDGLVLTNWEEQDFDPVELIKKLGPSAHRAGLDEGFVDPTAAVDSIYDEESKVIYVFNEMYGVGMTLDEIYDNLVSMGLKRVKIQCDSADPRLVDFLRRKGLYAVPCVKGQNSVKARIAFLQNNKIVVKTGCCPNLVKELSNFSYEKDRKTGKYVDDKYTHEWSHAIDALGYAYSDIYTKSKLRTLDKSILGI